MQHKEREKKNITSHKCHKIWERFSFLSDTAVKIRAKRTPPMDSATAKTPEYDVSRPYVHSFWVHTGGRDVNYVKFSHLNYFGK